MKRCGNGGKIILVLLAILFVWVGTLCLVFVPTSTTAYADEGTPEAGELRIHFIDCGQADACAIQFPDGKNMLIDAGDSDSSSYNNIITYLRDSVKITTLDYFIMTHADSDHIGGTTNVLEGLTVKTVYRPSQICNNSSYIDPALSKTGKEGFPYVTTNVPASHKQSTKTYANALDHCYEHAQNVYVTDPSNDEINQITGSATVNGSPIPYTFDFYSPLEPSYSDNNDYSPIMVLSYAGRNIVLSGDAEERNEAEFVAKVNNPADTDTRYDRFRDGKFTADIIKLGHHGSHTSSSEDYLGIMCANRDWRANIYTIASCGKGNTYAHPRSEVLQRLMDMKFSPVRIERTDLFGTIRFDIEAEGRLTRYRHHNYSYSGSDYKEDSQASIDAVLTSGYKSDLPSVTVRDNGVRPTEANGSATLPPTNRTPDWWPKLEVWQWVLLILLVVIIIVIIVTLIFMLNKYKKKPKSRGKKK